MTRSFRLPVAAACLGLGLIGGLAASQRLIGQAPLAPAQNAANAPVLPRDWMSYSPVVKHVLPAVVCLEGKGKTSRAKLDDLDPGFGSGFIVDPSGVVVTNNHVVRETTVVEVTLQDGRKFTSKDIRRDPKADVAVIKLDSKEPLPFLEFGDSNAMEVGDRVLAVGAPFGLTGSVTSGIVSGKSRNNLNLNLYEDFIQTDAAVNPGNSGGPLVNMEGRVIGLTAAIKTRSGGFQGVGLAVSSKLAKAVTEQLVKNGFVRRPWIGVSVVDLDDAAAAQARLKPGSGVVVSELAKPSPSSRANLGVGDVITHVNGQPVTTVREMQKAILGLPIGQPVEFVVVRKGQMFQTKVSAEEQPDNLGLGQGGVSIAPRMNFDALGLTVADLSQEAAAKMGFPKSTQAVVVSAVTPTGLAAQSGLARGMLILQVDRTPVANIEAFRKAVEQASRERGAVLHVLRSNGDIDYFILRGQ